MILTKCAVCAIELGLTLGKKCGRCSTRYCGSECQKQHWEGGGHDKLCKPIKKAGGAEQYNANKKYKESVAVAAEACAEATKGQTCYICLQAVHSRTGEGLVRGCACGDRDGVASGTTGIAHVSCLAEQAKILVAEAEENNLGCKVMYERWARWHVCSLCKQPYHGVVQCALGWACWKTYLGRPEQDQGRGMAMGLLAGGLYATDQYESALSVQETELSLTRRNGVTIGVSEGSILAMQGNLANTYLALGRKQDALHMLRDVYSGYMRVVGEEDSDTLRGANNYADTLMSVKRFEEAKALLRKTLPVAQRALGEGNGLTLKMRTLYASALYQDPTATLGDLSEAFTRLEETERTARRVLGDAHPYVQAVNGELERSRTALCNPPRSAF